MSTTAVPVRGSTIMVTGGCGFIGSHLVRHLLGAGARRVIVVDSLRYGDPANLGGESAAVEIVRHTLGHDDPSELQARMSGVDGLFHLAAEKHNQSKDSPIDVFRANIEGTYTLFNLAARGGVGKIVFTSSLYAYGRVQGAPFREDEVPRPATVYGISKLCGEHLLTHLNTQHGTAYNVLRYLFVFGPRQFAGMGYKSVIVKNFERLIRDQPPTIYGDGEQTLDYVYVDDVVEATVRALETDRSGEVLNVSTGEPTSVNHLIATMQTVAGKSFAPTYEPADWTAGSYRVGDNTKIRQVLAWAPRTSLHEGLRRTYEWMARRDREGVQFQ